MNTMFRRHEVWQDVKRICKTYMPLYPCEKYTTDLQVDLSSHPHQSKRNSVTVRMMYSCSLDAGLLHKQDNPLVLIFADDTVPGGSVNSGNGMQEETLFRRTALVSHLRPELYPLRNNEVLYCRDVPILFGPEKDDYPAMMDQNVTCSFIACPGIKMPSLVDGHTRLNQQDVHVLENKIRLILKVAVLKKHKTVILGALGCGVYGNPTRHVAQIMADVIKTCEYAYAIDTIIFAIPDRHKLRIFCEEWSAN